MSGDWRNFACDKDDEALRLVRIRRLNDQLRKTMVGGKVVITSGIEALGLIAVNSIIQAVGQFDEFSSANDPYDEHDFGAIKYCGAASCLKSTIMTNSLSSGRPTPLMLM